VAKSIATITGTALTPGVSRNGRLYTKEAIGRAVDRAQARIAEGKRPLAMRTHHALAGAQDDSTRVVGGLTRIWQEDDGRARYEGAIADTSHGRDIAALVDDSDGQPAFLRGVSIRGRWLGQPRASLSEDGQRVETADDLEITGLDFAPEPGVDDADVSTAAARETQEEDPYPIQESAPEALVTVLDEAAAPLKGDGAASPQTKAASYADPGYQPDKMKRFALDSKTEAKAAWSYIHQAKNAKNYTANQLKRIKGRIKAALKKFGVEVSADEGWIIDQIGSVTEAVAEHYMGEEYDARGSFCISLSNGPLNITISSYCVDPADLDVIGRAAMGAACDSLKDMDPDMDGDMDAPGADSEDTDHGMGAESAPDPVPLAESAPAVAESEPTGPPDAAPTDPAAIAADPAPEPAADPTTETEGPAMAESTTPAVEPTPAAPAAPGGITLTDDQFQALLSRYAPPAPATESAPAPAPAQAPAQAPAAQAVTETEDERITRIVEARLEKERASLIQDLVESGRGPVRKGLVRPVTEHTADPQGAVGENGLPEGWPDKPLHEYSETERRRYLVPAAQAHILGARAAR
jgi:uncharacterized protein DUF6582